MFSCCRCTVINIYAHLVTAWCKLLKQKYDILWQKSCDKNISWSLAWLIETNMFCIQLNCYGLESTASESFWESLFLKISVELNKIWPHKIRCILLDHFLGKTIFDILIFLGPFLFPEIIDGTKMHQRDSIEKFTSTTNFEYRCKWEQVWKLCKQIQLRHLQAMNVLKTESLKKYSSIAKLFKQIQMINFQMCKMT